MADPEAVGCHLCGKPALGAIAGLNGARLPICADHYIALQAVENDKNRHLTDQTRHAMAMMNQAADDMDAITGFRSGSRVAIPPPTPAGHYTSINVTDSTVGVINTAAVGQITANIGALPQGDPAKEALTRATAAVVDEATLSEADKKSLLDLLGVIAEQAAAKPAQRKPAVIVPMLAAITDGARAATALAGTWTALEPVLRAYFGL